MITNDTPITAPEDDHFGINPFAMALAKAIAEMNAPEGVVIGINGPWGSGKSSAVNLILYHLQEAIKKGKIKVVRFSPWWLSGIDAITEAFLEDLLNAIGPSVGDTAKKLFGRIARRMSRFSKIAELAGHAVAPGGGLLAQGAFQAIEGFIPGEEGIEAQHKKASELLAKVECRFLVIIDDIDRLGPDEAIEVFKLVKSVGQLSNVIYLLAFDRQLAERVVQDRFPSEGPHYLEKILQAAFEVPPASTEQLQSAFLAQVQEVCPPKQDEDQHRFWNIMLEGVTPLLKSPRDLNRFMGMLRVTWPAVADEVERADFVTMEALRLFMPDLYRVIRANPNMLTGYMSMGGERRDLSAEYNAFLSVIPEKEHERVKRALRRLFPKLDAIWGNIWHTGDQFARKFRRVCSSEHFNTYFRFAIGEDVLPATAITSFVEQADNRHFVQNTLRNALKVSLQSGATRASIYLEQLRVHADRIEKEKVPGFIKALLEIGEDLDVEEDQGRGFYGSMSNNDTRLWRLVWTVLAERFDQAERGAIILSAIEAAQLHTFIGLAERCKSQNDRQSYDEQIVDKPTADKLIELSRERLRAAAQDGGLLTHRHLFRLLWAWTRTGNGALEEVKEIVKNSLGNDQFILHLASSAAGVSWSMSMGFGGMGDLVSRRGLNVQRDAISPLIDIPTFLARLKEIAEKDPKSADATFVGVFMDAWNNSEHGDLRSAGADTPAEDARDADEAVSAEPLTEDDSSA